MNPRCKSQKLYVLLFLFLIYSCAVTMPAIAQRELTEAAKFPVLQGYITAVHLPDKFDINDCHVVLSEHTATGQFGDKVLTNEPSPRTKLHLGAFVRVVGSYDESTKTVAAEIVYFRDDFEGTLVGRGRILRVVSTGPEPIYIADGYQIRIKSWASKKFFEGAHSLSDVGPDTVISYKGRLSADGILDATRAKFIGYGASLSTPAVSQKDTANSNGAQVSATTLKNTAVIASDQSVQARVARVGASLVPAYMRRSPEHSPYYFQVVEDGDKVREAHPSNNKKFMNSYLVTDNLQIAISRQLAGRLQDDSQLAAVLAEGIAQTLQLHPGGIKGTTEALGTTVDGMTSNLAYGKKLPNLIYNNPILDRPDRIALQLMVDAGYDPHAAPEAWHIVASQIANTDLQSQPYPLRSGYQFNVLANQYQPHAATETVAH